MEYTHEFDLKVLMNSGQKTIWKCKNKEVNHVHEGFEDLALLHKPRSKALLTRLWVKLFNKVEEHNKHCGFWKFIKVSDGQNM